MAYASYSDLCSFIDRNLIADVCGDAGQALPGDNPVVQFHLDQASGRVRATARVAQTYTDAQLDALALAGDPMIVGLTVAVASYTLLGRRGGAVPEHVDRSWKQALSDLEALRDGTMIFGAVAGAATAGMASVQAVGTALPQAYGASYASNFYPPIANTTYPA